MIRKSLILMLLGVFLYAPTHLALGLGEIKLNSNLNEPLDAEITLLSVRGETTDQIIAMLGTKSDFDRSGIERLYFLTRIQFETVSTGNGRMVIRLTTEDAVKEPFLNFLVSIEWPNGKLLREYTLLLDPPIFDETPTTSVAQVQQPTQATTTQTETRPTRPATPTPRPQYDGDIYGPTTSSDTLWGIASKVRPARAVSVQRAMVALYEENPQAFMGGNINRLKRGAKLRIPTEGDFDQITQREALRLITEHELAWREGRDINRSVVDTSSANSQSRSRTTSNTSQSGRLSLATEQQSDNGTGGSNAAISEEENLVLKQQNQELEDEKRSQEERIEQLERLLELKNEQLAQLQNTTSDTVQNAQNTTSDTTPTQAQTQAENTPEQTEQATQPTPAQTSPMPEKGFVDQLLDGAYNLYLIILGVIIIVIALIMRFRGKDELSYQDALERSVPDNAPKSQSNAFRAEDLPDTADEVLADDSESYTTDDMAMEESADPVGEADIYMAYGKFDQAEDLLKRALNREPDRADLHAKLLECYSEMDSMASFEAHMDDVAPLIQSDSELSQMVEEVYTSTWPNGEYYNKQTSADASAEESAEINELSDELDVGDLSSAEDVFGDIDDADANDIFDELGEVDLDMDAGIVIDEAPEAEDTPVVEETSDAEESSATDETDAEEADADSDSDIDTQLDLASAYIEMGDYEGAREIIEEVLTTGDAKQKEQAQTLLDSIEN